MTLPPSRGTLAAEIPLTVEVWAAPADFTNIRAFVNRTCVAAELSAWKKKTDLWIRGCGLGFCVGKVGRGEYCIDVNVQTPYMPITTDGKEPDFGHFGGDIQELVGKAVRRGRRNAPATARRPQSQKQIILDALPAAIAKASGDGEYRFSIRQLFYAVRPYLLTALEQEPSYDWFAQVITDHEAETGADIPGIYRDSRGTLYHPHTHTEIPLGTLAVEKYRRPSWTFNKVLYCEKEGFFPILRAAQWPERHDCALLTSKGFASRAARDVLDLLGKTDEPLTFFCIHDADGPGTMIYEALQEGTRARPGRQVKIINLGLEVEEALEMKLQIEPVERKGNRNVTVAGYVAQKAREWLQEHRVELNAMPTPDFIAWLERKIAKHSAGKVLPPPAVTEDTLRRELLAWLRRRIRRRVLRRARVGRRAQAALARREVTLHEQASALGERILADLQRQPTESWLAVVRRVAEELGAGGVNVTSPPA